MVTVYCWNGDVYGVGDLRGDLQQLSMCSSIVKHLLLGGGSRSN